METTLQILAVIPLSVLGLSALGLLGLQLAPIITVMTSKVPTLEILAALSRLEAIPPLNRALNRKAQVMATS